MDDFPDSTWAAETLNNLASHYVILDDDAAADGVFRELFRRFPDGRYAERAAWKIGWWAYKSGRFADAAQAFDSGAAAFPRADTRPAWLYWSGRAHDQIGETAVANERYRVEVADYENSYYGRLASKHPRCARRARRGRQRDRRRRRPAAAGSDRGADSSARGAGAVRRCAEGAAVRAARVGRYAGDPGHGRLDPARAGAERNAPERFDHLRGAINIMKRAYPQFLAAGGEDLPPEVLEVIFPLDYWPLIKKYSDANGLDPYLMAALIAQESTFTADVRRRQRVRPDAAAAGDGPPLRAAKLGIRRSRRASLTQAGDEHPARDDVLQGSRRSVRRRALRARQLQRRREPRRRNGVPSGPASRRTSSSTTFRFPRRRTT